MAGLIVKGLIGKEDMAIQTNTAANETFTRTASTGVLSLHKIPDIWDGTGSINIGNFITKDPWVDIRAYLPAGFVIDGSVDYSTQIQAAITAAANKTLLIPINIGISTAITIPSTVSVIIPKEGKIIKLTGGSLIINGPLEAGLYQVFSGFTTGVTFGQGATKEVYPEWWYSTGDYAPAINSAIASIIAVGGTIKFTQSRELTSPVNATNINSGIIFNGNSPGSVSGVQLGPMLTIKHTGVGFDLTGSRGVVFRDLMIYGHPTTTPKVGFLLARNSGAGDAGYHVFNNVMSDSSSKFSIAVIYSYGSEVNNYYNLVMTNRYPGGKVIYLTNWNNINPVTSTFQTIATGGLSATSSNFFGGLLQNAGGTGSDIFYFDGASDINIYGVSGFNANTAGAQNGRAFFYVDTTNSGSTKVIINGFRSDTNALINTNYGIYFGNESPQSNSNWSFTNASIQAMTNVIYAGDDQIIYALHYQNVLDVGGKGLSIYNLQYSQVHTDGSYTSRGGYLLRSDLWGWIPTSTTLTLIRCDASTLHDLQYGSLYMIQSYDGVQYNGPVGTITLTANAASTTVNNHSVTANSQITLFPTTATAAADVGSATGVYISAKTAATSFVVTHPNNASADKTFNYLVIN